MWSIYTPVDTIIIGLCYGWVAIWLRPIRYPGKCWIIDNWTNRDHMQCHLYQNTTILIDIILYWLPVYSMMAVLFVLASICCQWLHEFDKLNTTTFKPLHKLDWWCIVIFVKCLTSTVQWCVIFVQVILRRNTTQTFEISIVRYKVTRLRLYTMWVQEY